VGIKALLTYGRLAARSEDVRRKCPVASEFPASAARLASRLVARLEQTAARTLPASIRGLKRSYARSRTR
jgi:hypothetical protein